jgi:hypothetical protein
MKKESDELMAEIGEKNLQADFNELLSFLFLPSWNWSI